MNKSLTLPSPSFFTSPPPPPPSKIQSFSTPSPSPSKIQSFPNPSPKTPSHSPSKIQSFPIPSPKTPSHSPSKIQSFPNTSSKTPSHPPSKIQSFPNPSLKSLYHPPSKIQSFPIPSSKTPSHPPSKIQSFPNPSPKTPSHPPTPSKIQSFPFPSPKTPSHPPSKIQSFTNPSPQTPSFPPQNSLLSFPQSLSFLETMLFLDSSGIDFFPLIQSHPPILSSSLPELRSSINFLLSLGFSSPNLRRICGMCPQILTCGGPPTFHSVLTFLLREAHVQRSDLCRVISRRPRLLVSDIPRRLRPTLHFLRKLGVPKPARHAHLLSCGVEEKLIPRLEFLRKSGFSSREAREMAGRFPQIFCYSVEGNLEPKLEFFRGVMGRELGEIRRFPQYFSFSLEGRIRPRWRVCKENAVVFELPALLKPNNEEFRRRLEVCVGSSGPLRKSPLWKGN